MAEGSETVRAAIGSFDGTRDALRTCLLANIPPTAAPEVQLEIPAISFESLGHVVVDGNLKVGGETVAHTVNGTIRLYMADDIGNLKSAPEVMELGRTFPVDAKVPAADASSQFFKITLEP